MVNSPAPKLLALRQTYHISCSVDNARWSAFFVGYGICGDNSDNRLVVHIKSHLNDRSPSVLRIDCQTH